MKKTILRSLTVISIFLMLGKAEAQVEFNLKQGMVASTFSEIGDLADNNHSKLSFLAGGFANIPISGILSVQPELNYLRKGRSESIDNSGVSIKTTTADYLQIPLLLRITPNNVLGDEKSKFFFSTGFYESILLNSKQINKTGNTITGNDITKSFKNTDFGLIMGAGIQFPFRQKNLQIELRYDMGLKKVTDDINNYHTKALSLTLGMVL